MSTASEILEKARSFIGVKETPAGSNNVLFNDDYYGHPVSGSAYSWCAVFVWDVFRLCGASSMFYNGQKTASCSVVQHWGRINGLEVPISTVRAGDLVLFDWNGDKIPDHIGFAAGSISQGSFPTVEGNVNSEVRALSRQPSQVCCVLRPKYAQEDPMLTRDDVQKMIEESVGKFIADITQVPESLQNEVRALLACGAINGGTAASVNPDDINLPLNILRAVVMAARYTNKQLEE